jgi:hypothetical protein
MNIPDLHGVGAHQHLGYKENAVAEVFADNSHAFDQRLGQNIVGCPAAPEKNIRAFLDFFLKPVIQIVVHLLDKFIIGKLGKDDFIVRHGFLPRYPDQLSSAPDPTCIAI